MESHRAARHESIWQATVPRGEPEKGVAASADVVVVGGGITGLTAALLLQQAGVDVVLVERRGLATGTTGNTTAKVSALQSTNYSAITERHGAATARAYAAANVAGVAMVERLARENGIACDMVRLPAVIHAGSDDGRRAVEAEAAAAHAAGLPIRDRDGGPGAGGPAPDDAWAALDDQYAMHPRAYCRGLAMAFVAAGGTVMEDTGATSLEADGGRRVVGTPEGNIHGDHVIVATLLPFPIAGEFFAKTRPSRSYALAAEVDPGDSPEAMYLGLDAPHRSVRPHTPVDGTAYVVVEGESHVPGAATDTAAHHAALEHWAREHLPVREIPWAWSAQDYMPVDGVPFVGPISSADAQVLVATGFGKWGMSNGTAAAMMLADRILGRDNPWAATFDSTRSVLASAAGATLAANVEVAKDFAATHVERVLARSVADLQPGEGDVVRTPDGARAVFRDEDGGLHAVSADCSHMGCGLRFNSAERSWDCPCHGSRFTVGGEVIEGPATKPLAGYDV
jgi:glycine/D-amino acid oxidase-like deaminating enzyme/nitrite reductase/ring-hydroxylating ferredoxin subunit